MKLLIALALLGLLLLLFYGYYRPTIEWAWSPG